MVTRARLDAELVRRGLARSRQQAAELIEQGRVAVRGVPAGKPATVVDRDTPVTVRDDRGARVGLPRRAQADRRAGRVRRGRGRGRRCLDAGASTGGFTDVLLDRGAAAGGRRRRRLRPAGLAAAQRRAGAGARPHQRPRARPRTPSAARSSSRWPTCRSSRCARCCPRWPPAPPRTASCCRWSSPSSRWAGSGSARAGWCAIRRCGWPRSTRSPRRRAPSAWSLRGAVASPLPGPSGNVEYFLRLPGSGDATSATRALRVGRRGGTAVTREVQLVLHVGRDTNRRTAATVARRLAASGIRLRVLAEEWAEVRRRRPPRRARARASSTAGRAAPRAPRSCWCSAATARCCGPRRWPGRRGAAARGEPGPGRLPGRGRAGVARRRPGRDRRGQLRGRGADDRSTRWRCANGDVLARTWALNEAAVEKSIRERILEVVLEVDGRPVSAFGCDGVLCATPTGSTAYAFSAGRPARLAAGGGPAAGAEQRARAVRPADGDLAGQPGGDRGRPGRAARRAGLRRPAHRSRCRPGARVELTRGAIPVRMVRLDGQPFADRLVRKFDLPVRGWRGAPHDR